MVIMVKQVITDEELTLKRQARRRLLGAIVLTIMVVVLLPMLLDKEPPAPTQDIELNIPDKDKVGEFVPKMALPPLAANSAVVQTSIAAASATPPVIASKQVIAPLLDTKPAPAIVPSKMDTKAVAEVKPNIKPEVKVETKPKVEPKTQVETKAVVKEAVKPSAKKHAGFVVQVGAFTHADAAKKLQEKLSKEGYPSYTEKVGNKTRVRIGDYATQAEADKIRQKLEIQGMKPDVVNIK